MLAAAGLCRGWGKHWCIGPTQPELSSTWIGSMDPPREVAGLADQQVQAPSHGPEACWLCLQGPELRDALLGRIFGYAAVIRSGQLSATGTCPPHPLTPTELQSALIFRCRGTSGHLCFGRAEGAVTSAQEGSDSLPAGCPCLPVKDAVRPPSAAVDIRSMISLCTAASCIMAHFRMMPKPCLTKRCSCSPSQAFPHAAHSFGIQVLPA